MYYSYPCPVCGKIFYTFSDHQDEAAQILYAGVEQHMKDYGEQEKDTILDHVNDEEEDEKSVHQTVSASDTKPEDAYELTT